MRRGVEAKSENFLPFLIAFYLLTGPALAAPCKPHDEAVALLADKYQEHQSAWGLGKHGKVIVELYTSDSGSFTILATYLDGRSCIIGAGEGWVTVEPQDDPV